MDTMDLTTLPAVLRVTYRVLAMRVMVYLALIMTVALFSFALYQGTWVALATSGTFALLVFLPVLYRCARKEEPDGQAT